MTNERRTVIAPKSIPGSKMSREAHADQVNPVLLDFLKAEETDKKLPESIQF